MISFSKYQGLGNDFLIIDGRNNEDYENIFSNTHLIKKICNRNFGIGSDGLILILKIQNSKDIRIRIFNSDGTEAEMCGNGVRCIAKHLYRNQFNDQVISYKLKTLAGVINVKIEESKLFTVDMGTPSLNPLKIPTKLKIGKNNLPQGSVKINGEDFHVSSVGMGNPHLLIIVKSFDNLSLSNVGPLLERNEYFPSRTNVHFIKIINEQEISIKVWERGAGETLACGTGACAALTSTYLQGLTDKKAKVNLPGGTLLINWPDISGPIFMTGPAEFVYNGMITQEFINKISS